MPAQWKGWTIPGPRPKRTLSQDWGDLADEPVTLDAISGHYKIYQYKDGHRFSTDDILVAWYGSAHTPSALNILDLGSGIGSVALMAAWKNPGATLVTIEAQERSIALARRSFAINELSERVEILCGDFRHTPISGGPFGLVLGSPPYFPIGTGIQSKNPQRDACRFETRGSIVDYLSIAAQNLAPGGQCAVVFPVDTDDQRERVLGGARQAGLCLVRQRDAKLKEDSGTTLGLFIFAQLNDVPPGFRDRPWIEPPLIIRDSSGAITREYSAIKWSMGFLP